MDLREMKKEVQALPSIKKEVENFQESWLKPVRSNTNTHLPFLQNLPNEIKKELNQKLASFNSTLHQVKKSEEILTKLNTYSRYLIELKLTQFRGNEEKSRIITNSLLNDDFLNMKQTITEVKSFEDNAKLLSKQYEEVSELLRKHLSLEEMVFYMNLPHLKYLATLVKTSSEHKRIVRRMGREFVSLARESPFKGR